jgi:hypothetical protein
MEVKANRVDGDDIDGLKNPGDFRWTGISNDGGPPGRMMFVCPCGCGDLCGVTLKPVVPTGWEWNRDFDKPTLTPSILINRGHWHGYLTDGVFRSC